MTAIGRYIGRKWWFLLLVAVLLALTVWVWRQALILPAVPVAARARLEFTWPPPWEVWVLTATFAAGWFYLLGKGYAKVLREHGVDDPHENV